MKPPQLDLHKFTDFPVPVATVDELRRKGRVPVRALGRELLIAWNDGRPRAFTDACPHLGLPLSMGSQRGDRLVCRFHGWAFSSDTGEVVEQPTLHEPHRCSMERFGALIAGPLVFAWIGEQGDAERIRPMLPAEIPEDFSLFRVTYETPFYLALFTSVDYAHFWLHTGYRPVYALYRRFRKSGHVPGTPFTTKIVDEQEHRVSLEIPEAERTIHMYCSGSDMIDARGLSRFLTFVTPVSPTETLYWECYSPRVTGPVGKLAARVTFRLFNMRFLYTEDRPWTKALTPNFLRGDNIHLTMNDSPMGAHLRKFVMPRVG